MTQLNNGMRAFFNTTGVRPLLYITDNVSGNFNPTAQEVRTYAENAYSRLIEDEASMLLVFYENNLTHQFMMAYSVGRQAQTVLDREAMDILFDYIEHYYYTSLDEAVMFGRAFSEAADRFMSRTTPWWVALAYVAVIGFILIMGVLLLFKRAKERRMEAEANEKILNTPAEFL
jgi:hypothetical protein